MKWFFILRLFCVRSVIDFFCQPGYALTGSSSIMCQADGAWSDTVPQCFRHRCASLPVIPNGFTQERQQTKFFFGDSVTVGCFPGFQIRGSAVLTCSVNETFGPDIPVCVDIDECQDRKTCDLDSTSCVNVPGDHYCQCRGGYSGISPCSQVRARQHGLINPFILISHQSLIVHGFYAQSLIFHGLIVDLPWVSCSIIDLPWILCSIIDLPWILCLIVDLPWVLCSIIDLPWVLCLIVDLP